MLLAQTLTPIAIFGPLFIMLSRSFGKDEVLARSIYRKIKNPLGFLVLFSWCLILSASLFDPYTGYVASIILSWALYAGWNTKKKNQEFLFKKNAQVFVPSHWRMSPEPPQMA